MKKNTKKIIYKDIPEFDAAELRIIKDDKLPSPDEIAHQLESRKVTIALSNNTIEFFKKKAQKINIPYQRLVRDLLDRYVHEVSKHTT